MRRAATLGSCLVMLLATGPVQTRGSGDAGLLFYLSGERGLRADVSAGGTPDPTFVNDVRVVADGARGRALQCGHAQLLAYRAPGNIYAARGTLSFYWRSREPVGPTPFPVFRVGYADHSSWDMVWLRIDYNGESGFDAFVTDASLARMRVSHRLPAFPAPDRWIHLAFSWDESRGIRFYVDGRRVGSVEGAARLDAALDQFGPHSRTIGPMQVQSAYNFVRGGDIDELRIYDRMLTDADMARLAEAGATENPAAAGEPPVASARHGAWLFRYGWNQPTAAPPPIGAPVVRIRKVEIHDVYDVKRWWWKGTDGIRETTWPGVYHVSRLPGRNDYFQLPDWDCYSTSGKSVTFTMPDEPWNHVEISGAAWGAFRDAASGRLLFERPRNQERTAHRLSGATRGGKIRFDNVEQEWPIGEFGAYYLDEGPEPLGIARLRYRLTANAEPAAYPSLRPLLEYIAGRHLPGERTTMVALPANAPRIPREPPAGGWPIVHILVPADFRDFDVERRRADFSYGWMNMAGGLDGIAIDLPALDVEPTHAGHVALNIQVRDPIWPLRTLLDVSLSVRPNAPHTLWLDTRDRILPNGRSLYLTIASASPDFGPRGLEGAEVRLIFKPRAAALHEHTEDRFTQVRDNFAHIVEERPNTRRLDLYRRFEADISDLLSVAPDHTQGRNYWYEYNREQPRPPVVRNVAVAGVPAWAVGQLEVLRSVRRVIDWYIDRRQIENGEFGGGLSDDGDFTNAWPGAAFMGVEPDKLRDSLLRLMEAYYAQGWFTNGLPTLQTDELHSYEEGIQVLGQALLIDYANPKHLERAMETARAIERLTGINSAGHRHFRSSYFSGTKVAEEGVWGWSKPSSHLILQPAIALVEYNGSPRLRRWLIELADALLDHRKRDSAGRFALRATVRFATDEDTPQPSERVFPLMWAAFRWTRDAKYLQPFADAGPRSLAQISSNALDLMEQRFGWAGLVSQALTSRSDDVLRHFAWLASGDVAHLETLYAEQAAAAAARLYINTEGSIWIDRVTLQDAEIQRARLGGVALVRNQIFPGHAVSWRFDEPSLAEVVAILVRATPRQVRITARNVADTPVRARMTAWALEPGTWRVDDGTRVRSIALERGGEIDVTFVPGATTELQLDLEKAGMPYWSRPDLGASREDVRIEPGALEVTVHSLGAIDAAAARIVVRNRAGQILGSAKVPPLKAPTDAEPTLTRVRVPLPSDASSSGGSVTIEMAHSVPEITLRNNRVIID